MDMDQFNDVEDERLVAAETELRQAKDAEDDARSSLTEARSRYERERTARERALTKEAEARSGEANARRQAEQAQRRSVDARQKELPRFRWEAQVRQWEGEAQRSAADGRRWADEVRRRGHQLRSMDEEVRDLNSQTQILAVETHEKGQRLAYLTQLLSRQGAAREPAPQDEPIPVTITDHASAFLKEILDNTEHEPHQLLRLMFNPDGEISLALDTENENDQVVTHQETAVLLIQSPLPDLLVGKTLDVGESSQEAHLVLSG